MLANYCPLEKTEKITSCCRTNQAPKKRRLQSSWLPAFLVAILPKCPFCIMAYSGAVTMCSGNNLYPHAGSYMSYITTLLALLILIGIGFNYKGRRTLIALSIALSGISLIAISQFYWLSTVSYYLGSGLLFLSIWYNGSLLYFVNRFKTRFSPPH